MQKVETEWSLIINSKNKLFNLNLGKVWDYRDLLMLLIRRDFVSFYKQTIFGPLWFFIQPLFTTLTFTVIFGRLAGISTDGIPPVLFYMVGITNWTYFSESLIKTSTVLRDNASIFGKVYFPRIIVPFSIVVSNLIKLGIQFSLLLVIMVFYYITGSHYTPTLYVLFFPFLVVLMAALGLGFGMIVSAMTVKYRDLAFLVNFSIQLLMYATPVIYPLSTIPEDKQWLILINPMSQIIELTRLGVLGKGYFTWVAFGYTVSVIFFVLLAGTLIFNKTEKNFVDTI